MLNDFKAIEIFAAEELMKASDRFVALAKSNCVDYKALTDAIDDIDAIRGYLYKKMFEIVSRQTIIG